MKKRVAAAFLGVMLSVSMGLEVPAAALDAGFESGFTSEQAGGEQLEADGIQEVQPSDNGESTGADSSDVPASDDQQPQEDANNGNTEDTVSEEDGFSDGFISGDVVSEGGDTDPAQNFESDIQNIPDAGQTAAVN